MLVMCTCFASISVLFLVKSWRQLILYHVLLKSPSMSFLSIAICTSALLQSCMIFIFSFLEKEITSHFSNKNS